ncbi:DUF4263 domain-containing protein [Rhizobium lentis]|uniref:Shedu immune nuclease family protein n=1 Tax=Rhizobium lentis TaxID=1138194 RepID=UPI001C83CA86|nr:Shedu immune nuclease family protein [Rhizobium lentis]MBX5132706.1 DUF4263 domain-containing protein [Rhizobium lentis]
MIDDNDYEFFRLRKEGKTYISKIFTWNAQEEEPRRSVRMVLANSDSVVLGEVEGAMCLRLTGEKRKTQVTAIVTQDDKQVRRLSFQTFRSRAGDWYEGFEKEEFTFRGDEFERLLQFLHNIRFIDLSNPETFQIEDISTSQGPKAIIDASDRGLVQRLKAMTAAERRSAMHFLKDSLTDDEVNILLGRREGLDIFEREIASGSWKEADWQAFFENEQWVFGYGLDYRIMRSFDREMVVGSGGADNQNKPTVDFLMTFTDYTVLVEIKKPDTRIFRQARGGRAGTWEFSPEFTSAVSQILEQRAEWSSFANSTEQYSKDGSRRLEARTRNARSILVIGSTHEFEAAATPREGNIMRDTFELYRREMRSIDIVTFDELLDRARFITRST